MARCVPLHRSAAAHRLRKRKNRAAQKGNVIAPNMGARWKQFTSGTLKTILAGFLYLVTLPVVRKWLMNLLIGKRKQNSKIIDVVAKKE